MDYKKLISLITETGEEEKIDLPASNVIQYLLEDGTKVTMRPSGTEPKIKFYFSVKTILDKAENFEIKWNELGDYIEGIKNELKLN